MKRTLVTVFTLLAASVAWWLWQAQPASTAATEPAATTPPSFAPAQNAVAPDTGNSTSADGQPASALARARQAKAAAEAELELLDRELAEVEAYIADIEAQGLDPVDFSEEGMAKMQPILAAYLDVEVRLAAAEEALEKALLDADAKERVE